MKVENNFTYNITNKLYKNPTSTFEFLALCKPTELKWHIYSEATTGFTYKQEKKHLNSNTFKVGNLEYVCFIKEFNI